MYNYYCKLLLILWFKCFHEVIDKEDMLDGLVDKSQLSILKGIIDAERERRLQDLESQLMREKTMKDRPDHQSPENQLVLDKDIQQLETSIEAVNNHYNHINEGLSNGFMKKCLNEVGLLKKNGIKTDEDISRCTRETAESIKERFQRDQVSLSQSLEQDRSKHKVKVAKSIETDKSLTEDQQEESDRNNHSCDKQETLTFSFANANILLALSSTNMDCSLLDGNSPGVKVNTTKKKSSPIDLAQSGREG